MRAYIATEKYMAVTALASRLIPLLKESQRHMDTCETYMLWAMSDMAAGRKDEALERFGLALELAQKYRYDRLLADEGKRVLDLLRSGEEGGKASCRGIFKLGNCRSARNCGRYRQAALQAHFFKA